MQRNDHLFAIIFALFCKTIFATSEGHNGNIIQTFVINLERRPERLSSCDKQLNALNKPYLRFNAIDGIMLKRHIEENIQFPYELNPKTALNFEECYKYCNQGNKWGEFGCWQSHLQLYFLISEGLDNQEEGPFLILEDDVLLEKDVFNFLEAAIPTLPSNWDVFYLGYSALIGGHRYSEKVYKPNECYSMHAYVLRNRSAAKKLAEFSNSALPAPSDHILSNASKLGLINIYAVYPLQYAIQNRLEFTSDIPSSETANQPKLRKPIS